ncbi:MAG: hypothetical protein M3N51_08890 [Actinomycetota bacterium]|nr:hypothetical protein [Actinomycetota bacterium]
MAEAPSSEGRAPAGGGGGVHIAGGAGPYEVAAVLAVLAQVIAEEAEEGATTKSRFTLGPWELSGRTRPMAGPAQEGT